MLYEGNTWARAAPVQDTLRVIAFVKNIKVPVFWTFSLIALPARVKHLGRMPAISYTATVNMESATAHFTSEAHC